MRVALDTNVLAYLGGVDRHPDDAAKIAAARALMPRLRERATLVVPIQALGELYAVLTRNGTSRDTAREAVLGLQRGMIPAPTLDSTLLSALDLAAAHRLQLWDALILTASAEAGAALLLSEDMGAGFTWRGCAVANPFADPPEPRLAALMA